MNPPPDPEALLDGVFSEESVRHDGLASILIAVRARRRRRRLVPFATAVLACVALAIGLFRSSNPGPRVLPLRVASPIHPVRGVVESSRSELPSADVASWSLRTPSPGSSAWTDFMTRVHSKSLTPGERVRGLTGLADGIRVRSASRLDVWATDDELLALAGGRGVALARMTDGRKELLFAEKHP